MSDDLFPGFAARRLETEGCEIFARVGGDGPPMLLLHGYPQTHAMWHRLAPLLAERFTLVCADLRGYGDSGKPAGDAEHSAYSKRTMAADQVAVMAALGYARFAVVGHDRGGRVAHRMCLDHPDKITRAAVLDIVPTQTLFQTLNQGVALAYYHWLFLAQPFDLPERLIGADPDYYLERKMGALGGGLDLFDPLALAEYKRCFRDPATIHATCEDYRAASSIDLAHDEADLDSKIACPLLVLWGLDAWMERYYDVLATWRERASDTRGLGIAAGHYLAEEKPDATAAALAEFLAGRR